VRCGDGAADAARGISEAAPSVSEYSNRGGVTPMISQEELRQIKLFQSVELESIKGLIDACTIRSLEKGEELITAGRVNRTVYFLLSGSVHVHL
jgi:hypothetical protein